MKRTIIIAITTLILVAVIGLTLNITTGSQTVVYLSKQRVAESGLYTYTFDFQAYLKNLETSITGQPLLELPLPSRQWITITSSVLEAQFWADLGNDLALILDYIILPVNVLLYPIRLGSYLILNLFAIVGVSMNIENPKNGLGPLITTLQNMIRQVIPYV